MACTWAFPTFRAWPWVWVAPLAGYSVLVASLPPLRQSILRPRVGEVTQKTLVASALTILATTLALPAFQVAAQPELDRIGLALPVGALGGLLLAGVIFTVLNATLEEVVCRVFDALDSEWGSGVAVLVTSILFALGQPGPPQRARHALVHYTYAEKGGLRGHCHRADRNDAGLPVRLDLPRPRA